LDSEVHKRQAAVFTYLKSRGFYAGVQIDGTIIIERTDENERFYGHRIPVAEILAGKVRHPPFEVKRLLETVRAAQGDTDVDESFLPTEAPPSDYDIEDGSVFGVPDKEDPDPYGVLALEKEGLSIKEAGTQKRASWEAFSFHPSPSSPVRSVYERTGFDRRQSGSARKSWRMSSSTMEINAGSSARNSIDRSRPSSVVMADMSTQTDNEPSESARSHTRNPSAAFGDRAMMQEVPEDKVLDTYEETEADNPKDNVPETNGYSTPPQTPPMRAKSPEPIDENDHEDHEHHEDDIHIEEPIAQSVKVYQSSPAQVISKARLISVPKREPPRLPPRNPNRFGGGPMIIDASPRGGSSDDLSVASKHDSAHELAHEPTLEKSAEVEEAHSKLREIKLDDIADHGDIDAKAKTEASAAPTDTMHSELPRNVAVRDGI